MTVRDAQWRARTNRATPIEAGDAVRVVAIDGLCSRSSPRKAGRATTASSASADKGPIH